MSKIKTVEDLLKHLKQQAKEYRKEWKDELTESEDIEEYGLNEFLGGKAEVYEDVAELLAEILTPKTCQTCGTPLENNEDDYCQNCWEARGHDDNSIS